jgi:Acetyltransferase (GNAT) domain
MKSVATSREAGRPLELRWVRSIRDVGEEAWNACFPRRDVMQSYQLHAATEAGKLGDVEFHYLVARDARGVAAVVPCFAFRMSLTVVAPDPIARAVALVRRALPGFLYLRAFVVGTPIAICKDLLGLRADLRGRAREETLRALLGEVVGRAKRLGLGLILIKEITRALLPDVKDALAERFTLVESPPTTYLYLGEPGRTTYRGRLRKKYRSLMNNRQARIAEAGMRWELTSDFSRYADRMHPLYLQVLHRSKIRFETLTVDFFAQLPAHLGDRVLALLCFKGDELVAFELFLRDDEWTHPIYLGIDYRHRDEGALYFNCLYKIIEILEAEGRPAVQLGQTSYLAKASIGAVVDRLYLAIGHTHPVLDAVLRRFGSLMFPATETPRAQRVFRDMKENDEGLARRGIQFDRADA